ncbi:MAG: GIY-YIG nuclease family protein, partial [Thermoleophilaceae bacterium]
CALLPRLCASAATVADAVGALRCARRRAKPRMAAARRAPADRPEIKHLPDDPGVYVFRDERGQPLYVGKSVSLRTRARAHFCAPAGWTERAEIVDYRPTNSELGALVLENRLIKQWRPAGNTALKRTDRWAYVLCRLDIEYPVLEVSSEPATGHAVSIGPIRGRKLAGELADHLTSLYRLRHCGRSMRRREHPSIYGQMGRCCSPCLGDLDPNAYRRQLDTVLALFDAPDGAAAMLLAGIDERLAAASAERRYERATALLRRRERLDSLLFRLDGVLRAVHSGPRLVVARHPVKNRFDALWMVHGRVADWGPLPDDPAELSERCRAVLANAPPRGRSVLADEVDEVRIASAWIAEHRPPELALSDAREPGRLERFLSAVGAG